MICQDRLGTSAKETSTKRTGRFVQVKCAALKISGAFEPFGQDIAWPYPPPPPPHPQFRCGSAGGQCVESGPEKDEVSFSDAATCGKPTVCTGCTNATVVRGKCVHELANAISNATVVRKNRNRRFCVPFSCGYGKPIVCQESVELNG
jgi:hypothetical protein